MHLNETDLKGLTLDSKYVIRRVVRETGGVMVCETEHDEGPALLLTVKDGTPEAERRLKQWTAARELSHSHLVRVLDGGRAEMGGADVLYWVIEKADDSLEGVLEERPLTADETAQVLDSVTPALDHLHAAGWLHGAIEPASVVAVGDNVKLTIDTMRPGNSPEEFAGELRALGAAARTMLGAGPDLKGVPSELRARISSLLTHKADPKNEDVVGTEPSTAEPVQTAGMNWKIPAIVAAVALIIALPFLFRSPSSERSRVAPQNVAPPPSAAEPAPAPAAATTPIPTIERPPVADPNSVGQWAVVAAIYRDHAAAVRRAKELAKKWHRSPIEVYPSAGQGSRYMVVVGKGLTRKAADKLRSQARSGGLPRDTYVTKLDVSGGRG